MSIGLYQCHLPKLDDLKGLAFDQHRGSVRLRFDGRILQELQQEGAAQVNADGGVA